MVESQRQNLGTLFREPIRQALHPDGEDGRNDSSAHGNGLAMVYPTKWQWRPKDTKITKNFKQLSPRNMTPNR